MKLFSLFLGTIIYSLVVFSATTKIVAFGDAPYFDGAKGMFEKLMAQTERLNPDLVVHVGDIGTPDNSCTKNDMKKTKSILNSFTAPLVYTPGDNEWTDCHRVNIEPLKALKHLRSIFYSDSKSLGQKKIILRSQSEKSRFKKFKENNIWIKNEVLYFTLHVVGSNNNIDVLEEYNERMEANLWWLNKAMNEAENDNIKAVVMVTHANYKFKKSEDERRGFEPVIQALRKSVSELNKPVLMIQGDHHKLIIDNPIKAPTKFDMDWPLPNFTRLQVYGAPDVRGVEINIDTAKKQPFAITPMPHITWEYPTEVVSNFIIM